VEKTKKPKNPLKKKKTLEFWFNLAKFFIIKRLVQNRAIEQTLVVAGAAVEVLTIAMLPTQQQQ
jgi:hypothetical protein